MTEVKKERRMRVKSMRRGLISGGGMWRGEAGRENQTVTPQHDQGGEGR